MTRHNRRVYKKPRYDDQSYQSRNRCDGRNNGSYGNNMTQNPRNCNNPPQPNAFRGQEPKERDRGDRDSNESNVNVNNNLNAINNKVSAGSVQPSTDHPPRLLGQIPRRNNQPLQDPSVVVMDSSKSTTPSKADSLDANQIKPKETVADDKEPSHFLTAKKIDWCDYKKWDEMNHLQKIRYLTPRMHTNHHGQPPLPDEAYYNMVIQTVAKEPSKERIEKMKLAVQASKEAITNMFRNAQASMVKSDSDDSDRAYSSDESVAFAINGITMDDANRFVHHLPQHLLFTVSFDEKGTDISQSKLCICPCSKKKSEQWHKLFNRSDMGSTDACHRTFEHFALLAHLRDKGDPYHVGTLAYLEKLYSNHYPIGNRGNGYDHEALYINKPRMNHILKEVTAYRNRLRENKLADLKGQIEKYRKQYDCGLKLTKEETEELGFKRKLFDRLGLTGNETTVAELSSAEICRIDSYYRNFWQMLRWSWDEQTGIVSEDIPQPVKLNSLFKTWSQRIPILDRSFLFRDLRGKDFVRLLNKKPQWNFQDQAKSYNQTDERRDKGVDHGGLTRAFLQSVWDQLHELSIDFDGKTKISLFRMDDGYCVPLSDNSLGFQVDKLEEDKDKEEAWDRVQLYYRAVGRLLIHSLATDHVLPNHVMPPFYRDYFFCNRRPGDEVSYMSSAQKLVLYGHIQQMGFSKNSFEFDEEGEQVDDPKWFLQNIDKHFVGQRSIALSSIYSGLVLADGEMTPTRPDDTEADGAALPTLTDENRRIDLRTFFFRRSIQIVNDILFASPEISADLVIKNLKAKTLINNESCDLVLNDSPDMELPKRFMEETLPNLLRRKEREEQDAGERKSLYARRFLKFVTGLAFINRRSPYVYVCFRREMDQCARPEAHTCENALDIPMSAYDCFEETLDEYLDEAFQQTDKQEITTS